MQSAFGVDHGDGDIEKGFGTAVSSAAGSLKKLGQGLLGGGGARRATGGPKLFGGQTGGKYKAAAPGARKATGAAPGARKATGAAPATSSSPMYAGLAQKYGINQGGAHAGGAAGRRKAF